MPGVGDLATFDAEYWDDSVGGHALVTTIIETVERESASDILIESVKLVPKVRSPVCADNVVHVFLGEFACEDPRIIVERE